MEWSQVANSGRGKEGAKWKVAIVQRTFGLWGLKEEQLTDEKLPPTGTHVLAMKAYLGTVSLAVLRTTADYPPTVELLWLERPLSALA
jgi:hypothetical protein